MNKENVAYTNTHTHTHTHTQRMKYYSAIKKEILIFATTWKDLDSTKLSEISQRKTNITWSTICGI